MAEKFLQKAIKRPGALHRSLGIPEGEKIPASRLEAATHSKNPHVAKMANLAETMKKFSHHHPNPHPAPHAKHAHRQTHPATKMAHHASGK